MADKRTNDEAEKKRKDDELEEGLEESFPASDPPSETQPHSHKDEGDPKRE